MIVYMKINSITILGVSLIFFYCLTKILSFYGITSNYYGTYIAFYIFMILTSMILPHSIT